MEASWALLFLTITVANSSLFGGIIVADDTPDITSFHSNGFIYEFKDKKLIASLFIGIERLNSVSVYYLNELETLVRYYLVFTTSNKLLILKKSNAVFEIVNVYENVKQFTVFDVLSMGYPQIEITFTDNLENFIFSFSGIKIQNLNTKMKSQSEALCSSPFTVANYLSDKLQMMNRCIDELTEEKTLITKSIQISSVGFLNNKPLHGLRRCDINILCKEKHAKKLEIDLLDFWRENYGNYCIFGVRIQNKSNEKSSDIKVIINNKSIAKFRYAFFSVPKSSHWPSKTPSIIESKQDSLILGAFKIPPLISSSFFSFDCSLFSTSLKEVLSIAAVNWDAFTLWTKPKIYTFDKVNDVLSMIVVFREIGLVVETESQESGLLQTALEKMDFICSTNITKNFFYSSINKIGVVVNLKLTFPCIWKLHVFVRRNVQLYLFVNALYDILPDNVSIVYCNQANQHEYPDSRKLK